MSDPKLDAEFVLLDKTSPAYIQRGNRKHYKIRLSLANFRRGAKKAKYKLHPSYFDPVRVSANPGDNFAEEITSYGDFDIQASLHGPGMEQLVIDSLSRALLRHYGDAAADPITDAISDIRGN